MPSGDWTLVSTGAVADAIVADGASPSPPDVMEITATTGAAAGMAFENITGGPFLDSRISAWFRNNSAGVVGWLVLRSQDDTTFVAAPATFFAALIAAPNATEVTVTINAVVAGVVNTIVSTNITSVNGDARTSWQQYQFSVFNDGTQMLLRVAQWNGGAFVPVVDAAAPIASFPALNAAGSGRFGSQLSGLNSMRIDDVNYYSLT